jgi:hypothetical protein
VRSLIVFTIFCFLKKSNSKFLHAPLKLLPKILKIPPITCFKDPKAAIVALKMLTGSRL